MTNNYQFRLAENCLNRDKTDEIANPYALMGLCSEKFKDAKLEQF